ncbi:polyol transporter 5-like [Zingiber officinale]|uniref:polyol transporter 5-like n=1 Tax=Zingiber officinale TaxID=94328 RepID=UPI001C4DAA11|nr:polyol transporter 5-like [Zingiber officinale]
MEQAPAVKASPAKPRRNYYALGCSILASMTSVVLGYDVAVMSGANMYIKDDLKISDTQIEILSGIINLYSIIGSIAAGRTSDWIGRRNTMILACAIFFTGALTMGLAPSYAVLMVGRFVAGIGVGYALMIAPVYAAEVAPSSSRGFLSSFPEVFINFGVLLGYVSNFAFNGLPAHLNWRVMLAVGAVPPVFLSAGVLFMPESPRWLVIRGRIGEAKEVLRKTSDTPAEAELRLAAIKEAAGIPPDCADDDVAAWIPKRRSRGEGVWKELLVRPTPVVRRILFAALGLQFFQQASGIDSVVLYSPTIFEKAGLQSKTQRLGATVAVGFSKTSCILVATFLLDRVGRRPLLLSSAGGMVASLLTLASCLRAIERQGEAATWAVVLCIVTELTFVGSFSIGLGPIAWVYCSEIFPLRLRAQGASLGAAMNRLMSGAVTMSFLSLYKAISIAGSFYLYAGIAAAGWLFFFIFLPETRGRSLEDMEELFGKKGKAAEIQKGGIEMANEDAKANVIVIGRD